MQFIVDPTLDFEENTPEKGNLSNNFKKVSSNRVPSTLILIGVGVLVIGLGVYFLQKAGS